MFSFKKVIFPFALLVFSASCHTKKDLSKSSGNEEVKISSSTVSKYAALLAVTPSELRNKKLIQFLDTWYGVPYKWGGNTKNGVDCSHLVCETYKEVYGRKLSGNARDLEKMCEEVNEQKLHEGDLVFFKIESSAVSHVGIYITNNHFMHASVKKGVMINSLDESYYKKYFFRGGRLNKNIP